MNTGGIIAIPTDTVYGLAVRAFDPAAVARVFEVKGRDSQTPLPLLLTGFEMVEQCASPVSIYAERLANVFWPGPLTIVVPRSHHIPDAVTSGGPNVGLRVPDHPVPVALAGALGEPITGTSANRTGEPAFTSYQSLKLRLGSELDYIIDGGALPLRPASTVVDLTGDLPLILRQGGVSKKDIETALGVEIHPRIV